MWPLIISGIVMLIVGAIVAGVSYATTDEGEYPFWWWLGWAVCIGGLLFVFAGLTGTRGGFIAWAIAIGIVGLLTFLFGKFDDEFLPSAWVGVSILLCAIFLWILGDAPSSNTIVLVVFLAAGIIAFIAGVWLRSSDQYYYDFAYTFFVIALCFGILFGSHSLRTPLEQLNEALVPQFNSTAQIVDQKLNRSYPQALKEAQKYRATIESEFADDEPAALVQADSSLKKADTSYSAAEKTRAKAGQTVQPYKKWSAQDETGLKSRILLIEQADREVQAALDDLGNVGELYRDLGKEWVRTIEWTEYSDYWSSEEYEVADTKACYYGELVSTIDDQGKVTETLVDDDPNGGLLPSDAEGKNWKVFTHEDYVYFVNNGLVPAKPGLGTSLADVGQYLCGPGGVFADANLPATIVKERGVLKLELEDGSDAFVGNYRYGQWCTKNAAGHYQGIAEDVTPPANAEWCWYQPSGRSTQYYWIHVNNTYIQGPRRCIYCTPTNSWSGDSLVSSTQMSSVNKTDASSIRGPKDIGGGPGTGK